MQAQTFHVRITDGRRIVLPPELCHSLSVGVGDTMVVRLEDNHVTLDSVERTIDRFQQLVADRVPAGTSLVDELIADRTLAAQRE